MAKTRNIFVRGVMDKDTDRAYIKQGIHRHAENLRFHINDGDDGVANNLKGSLEVSDATEGRTDLKCIAALHNKDLDVIYYYLASTSGLFSKIVEYNILTDTTTDVLHDTNGILNLDKDGYITGLNEIDGLLFWSEWGNNVRRVNVERAKTYGTNGFTEDDIKVIVKPPFQKLRLTLENTDTSTQQENNIEEKFLYFSYRYRYLDGEYSVLAPFTKAAFKPRNFQYDFVEQSNRSMVNRFNQVLIEFNTGSERVTEIQLVFKESESNAVWVIDDFNKAKLGYGNNQIESHPFFNNKVYRALSSNVLPNIMDNVPRTSKAQELIDGRLLYAHYKENYDIVDINENPIEMDYTVELVAEPNTVQEEQTVYDENNNAIGTEIVDVPSLEPKETAKSNRDYEVGVVYGDDDGRITTILNSKTNTRYIPNENSVTQNHLEVVLKNLPPKWATYYRFFIKQNKKGYDQLLPTLFYEDGVYRWVKLEGADKDKVREGDYLIVKSDTQAPIVPLIKVKVLEVVDQPKNFLQPDDVTDVISERAGLYFKIKPEGFRIDLDDYDNFLLNTYDTSANRHDNPISGLAPYISEAHFYGDTLNDLTSGGSYTGSSGSRTRFLIKIDGLATGGDPDTFRWSIDDGANWIQTDVDITAGVPQPLQDGVEITFAADTGHSLLDEWNINGRATFGVGSNSKSFGFFRVYGQNNEVLNEPSDERIFAGARIRLTYDEYNEGNTQWEVDVISNGNYDNIQEWFYKEDIFSEISPAMSINRIRFVRGILYPDNGANRIVQDDAQGIMTMVVESNATQNNDLDGRVKTRTTSEILQADNDNRIVFETEPTDQPPDIYFEIGKNYRIINGYHSHITDDFETEIPNSTGDQSQTATQDLRVRLDWFNAFSYGNAVESYKIRDEFNRKGIDVGVRPLTNTREEYKEVTRTADITWSDVYNDDTDFNGLNTFNLSLINFVKLDKEDGTIQKLFNDGNRNVLVLQEDAIGIMPYNKNIINDVEGGKIVGIATNILNRNSYREYARGKHGISKNPESFVSIGSRRYFTDKMRGDLIRLSIDGITTINQNLLEHNFSDEMIANRTNQLVGGFDPKHGEYVLHLPESERCLVFKELAKGFPSYYTFEPDFMLGADNEFYAWKDGVMYKMYATENRNEFFKEQFESKICFFVNDSFSEEKVFNSIGIEGSHTWDISMATRLTSRDIPRECFTKLEDFFYSEIMGNTNGETQASSIFGLGEYPIVNGEIFYTVLPEALCVGDFIRSANLLFPPIEILDILPDRIVLDSSDTTVSSFLMYEKNQNINGSSIRGDVLKVDMTNNDTEKIDLRAVRFEIKKSNYS